MAIKTIKCKIFAINSEKSLYPRECIGYIFVRANKFGVITELDELVKLNSWFDAQPKHIYIATSELSIKPQDWFCDESNIAPEKCYTISGTGQIVSDRGSYNPSQKYKIIATTNSFLNLPKISDSLIRFFINRNGLIDSLQVPMAYKDGEGHEYALEEFLLKQNSKWGEPIYYQNNSYPKVVNNTIVTI